MSSSPEIHDPHYQEKVRDSFSRQQFMQTLGASLTNLAPGVCEISMPYHDSLTQQHKFMHGGAIGAIADSAAGYAAFSLSPPNSSVLTAEYKINLLAPAKGDQFVARAKVLKSGRTLQIVFCEVFAIEGKNETLCAAMMATIMTLQNKSDRSL